MCLQNLRWSEIDYKFSVYAWHPDSPAIPIVLHKLKIMCLVVFWGNGLKWITVVMFSKTAGTADQAAAEALVVAQVTVKKGEAKKIKSKK